MIEKEKQELIFASLPPKSSTQFTWRNKIYQVHKGYFEDTDVSQELALNDVVITIELGEDWRSEETAVNHKIGRKVDANDANFNLQAYGEKVLADITVRVFVKRTGGMESKFLKDKVIDKLIEWYLMDLNTIHNIVRRSKVSKIQILKDDSLQREVTFTISYVRKYVRKEPTIGTVTLENQILHDGEVITSGGIVAYSLD